MRVAAIALVVLSIFCSFSPALSEDKRERRREEKAQEKRAKIDKAASEALEKLFAENARSKVLYDKAYGWAVFDNYKLVLAVSSGGGYGVAVEKSSGERTYMQMKTLGVSVGLGAKRYRVVFFFQDEETFRRFVDKGWQADAGATAAAGRESAAGTTSFSNGLAIYQLTEKGLMLSADLSGTKYWKSKKLN